MPRQHKRNSIYHFFLFSYIAILLIALSSCVVYAIKMHRQVLHETSTSKQVALSSVQMDLESNLKYIQERGDALAFNQNLIMYLQYPELYSVQDAMKALKNKEISKNYVLDAFIYLKETDEVITSTIRMPAPRFFDIIYEFVDVPLEKLKQDILQPYHFHEYLPAMEMRQYDSANTLRVIPYMQSLPIRFFENPSAQLVLIIDEERLFARADALHAGTGADVYVLNKQGQTMYASANAQSLDVKTLAGREAVINSDGKILNRLLSDATGWQYVLSTPYNIYYRDTFETLFFVFGVFVLYLVLGLILVRRLARRSYRPVKDIKDLVAKADSALPTGHNEFEVIKHALLSQMKSHTELHSMLDAQQPAMLRDCLSGLVNARTRDFTAARQRLEKLGFAINGDKFLCVMAELDTDSPYFTDSDIAYEESLSLARLIVQNVGCELLQERYSCRYLDTDAAAGLFIVNIPNSEQKNALGDTADIMQNLVSFTEKHFMLNIMLGVSRLENGPEGLPLCLDEARKALEHGRYHSGSEVSLFESIAVSGEDYYYPPEAEQQFTEYLRAGNAQGAHEILDRLLDTNLVSRHLSNAAARSFLYQLTATLQRHIYTCALSRGEQAAYDTDLFEKIINGSGLEHSRTRLHELTQQLVLARQERPVSRTEKLVDQLADFIDAHSEDAWLDLNSLSQQFNVTPQYISNIFKKYRSENIKSYIAKRKLVRAKELLEKTDLPVREIAERLGYANEIGIIRLFRKYTGLTPGEWRMQNKR